MQRNLAIGLVLALLMLVTACGVPAITLTTPPEIVYGEDVCEHCGMIINDERFAAGVVVHMQPDRYEHRIFDDIGDMFAYDGQLTAADSSTGDATTIVTYFVHDYTSQDWLNAKEAHFVKADSSLTPMGSGLAAFASEEAATAQAQLWHGTVLSFDAARQQIVDNHSHAAHP
jgi:copper chaperone NosL